MASESGLDEAFEAYRDVERPSQGALDDTWAALEARIAAGDTGPRLHEDDDTATGDARGRGRAFATVVAVAAALGALWLVSPSATRLVADDETSRGVESEHQAIGDEHPRGVAPRQHGTPPRPRSSEHRDRAGGAVVVEPEPEHDWESEPMPDSASDVPPEPEARPKPSRRTPAKAERAEQAAQAPREPASKERPAAVEPGLADQARELQRIRAALTSDPKAALQRLEDHRERAPASPLAREREALMLLAECRLGHARLVRDRVARVVEAQPGSPLAKRISEACGDDD